MAQIKKLKFGRKRAPLTNDPPARNSLLELSREHSAEAQLQPQPEPKSHQENGLTLLVGASTSNISGYGILLEQNLMSEAR